MVGCNTASIIFHEENFHQHDCDCWVVDNSKVMALGWEPKYELRTGLKETLKAMGVI
jgi:nucleoside-diphosphate-sugar epimerase